eukprot:gnl/MRDRNA2_/MRDRNA2_75522_c0_seq1.p1 gnl/MRDRNA2_/MRDRNA2_75522_c0~~gnl/MRDRNA2_/MRDRNA2_75522_c0_seq1.p1  ORF type:complete len:720 (+),score=88.83 gnl/MRDRNA2_/MRDRNA2_75522_c0_seq1:59-2161(+)
MGLPPHLLEYAENIWRRFPEEMLALGGPGLEYHYDHKQAQRCIHEDHAQKIVRISVPNRGMLSSQYSFPYEALPVPQPCLPTSSNFHDGFGRESLHAPTVNSTSGFHSMPLTSEISSSLRSMPQACSMPHTSDFSSSLRRMPPGCSKFAVTDASCSYPHQSFYNEQEMPRSCSSGDPYLPPQPLQSCPSSNGAAVLLAPVNSKSRILCRGASKPKSTSISGGKAAPLHLIPNVDHVYQNLGSGGFHEAYDIEGEIGQGSFGIVYKARSRGPSRVLRAVKKIDKSKVKLEALKNEINSLLNLDHPHIVKLIRYYDEARHLHLIFELCTGPNLHEVIEEGMRSRRGCMNERDIAVALRHMLKALRCCHGQYLGHYDIKPENFMYRTPERTNLKMIDLGMSSGFTLGSNSLKGTYDYMAPEIYRGIYGPEADVWSCGVVLFAMLTGVPFFHSNSRQEIEQFLNDRRRVLERVKWASRQGISVETYGLLRQMLMLDRHMRITVGEAIRHPFIAESYTRDLHDDSRKNDAMMVLEGLQDSFSNLSVQPMLTRATLMLTAHLVAHDQNAMSAERLAFRMLDRAGNGELSLDALEQSLEFYNVCVTQDMSDLFLLVDTDGDGYISFMDFLSVTLPPSVRSDETNFHGPFKFFDTNDDGFIDAADLINALGYTTWQEVQTCHDAIREVCSGPGPYRLSFKQFLQLLQG